MNRHRDCKFFASRAYCLHITDDVMKEATQNVREYHGGKQPVFSFPENDGIDAICSSCEKFTPSDAAR